GEDIVQEMIIVLSRTTLRDLESIEVIADIRKKYNRGLLQTKKEDPWEYFKGFCRDCVEAHEKALESNGRELIDRINTYIQNHYKEDLNLNRIAEVFYISPNYLSTLFNEKNHMSFRDYLQNLRIEEGKRYLRVTTAKVNDVAKKVGYKNTSYFVNVFRKNVGMTPNEYRKSSIKSSL
ncbi:MAG: AraC family transcriptional regulator, partial [Thermotaleaceae bacterium]